MYYFTFKNLYFSWFKKRIYISTDWSLGVGCQKLSPTIMHIKRDYISITSTRQCVNVNKQVHPGQLHRAIKIISQPSRDRSTTHFLLTM